MMDSTDLINKILQPVSDNGTNKGIHKIAVHARMKESLHRPLTSPAPFTFMYVVERLVGLLAPPEEVKIKLHRVLWILQAYYRFLVITNLALLWTLFSHPLRIFIHPLDTFGRLLFFVALQLVGIITVLVLLALRLTGLYDRLEKRRAQYAQGYSLFNMGDPSIFTRYNENIEKAKRVFALGREYALDDEREGVEGDEGTLEGDASRRVKHFHLDVSKALLLFSSAMYERNEECAYRAILDSHAKRPTAPAELVQAEARSREIAGSWGVQFAGISDLNTYGGAYCGLWWDPHSNWLVVSFKGTTFLSGAEWLNDLKLEKTNANAYLFGSVTQGFYEKLFPDFTAHVQYSTYGNIVQTLKLAAKELKKDKVNLFITGHGHGGAIATAFYARAIKSPEDFGEHIQVCDAYVFGAPRIGDVDFGAGFYSAVNQPIENSQALFRVINNLDVMGYIPIGATSTSLDHAFNFKGSLFNYAHIGEGVHINGDVHPLITGNSFAPGVEVRLVQDDKHYGSSESENGKVHEREEGHGIVRFIDDVKHLNLHDAKKLVTKENAASVAEFLVPAFITDSLTTSYMYNLDKLSADVAAPHKPRRFF
jgi:hypothetical protein